MIRHLPLLILVVFWLVDAAAGYRLFPGISVSEQVWGAQDRWGVWAYLLLGSFGVLLALHLFIRWPLGRTA